ncbi:sigma-70 family RNA polymerase sigma factor [Catenovulum agarivorans]|uniref:sigma-70 family RNA polymerase sigma factor n=1 Tax=Catenovulum agarivorans TaxID=1172192 RepID=UPI0002FDDA91|nr:sigma-70 family RNA polymerase sigma factor [Catenovulum agarivorans]
MSPHFLNLIKQQEQKLTFIARRYSAKNESDDLYQEIVLQLWRSFQSFSAESTFETWMYRVALNTAYSYVRKDKTRVSTVSDVLVETEASDLASSLACQADLLLQFAQTLAETDSAILIMYLDNFTSEQTGDVLGISANAVRQRLNRIKTSFEQSTLGA